jgi:hypothetical protein
MICDLSRHRDSFRAFDKPATEPYNDSQTAQLDQLGTGLNSSQLRKITSKQALR